MTPLHALLLLAFLYLAYALVQRVFGTVLVDEHDRATAAFSTRVGVNGSTRATTSSGTSTSTSHGHAATSHPTQRRHVATLEQMFPHLDPVHLAEMLARMGSAEEVIDAALSGRVRSREVVPVVSARSGESGEAHAARSGNTYTTSTGGAAHTTSTANESTVLATYAARYADHDNALLTTTPSAQWLDDADERRSLYDRRKAYMLAEARRYVLWKARHV